MTTLDLRNQSDIVRPELFGAVPGGVVDCAPALGAAILSRGEQVPQSDKAGTIEVVLGPGEYRLGSTLHIRRAVSIRGAGRFATRLIIDHDGPAVILHSDKTWFDHLVATGQADPSDPMPGLYTEHSEGSQLSSFSIWGPRNTADPADTSSTEHGIVVNARVRASSVHVSNMRGHGWFGVAYQGQGTNINQSLYEHCTGAGCGLDGFYFAGSDANQQTLVSCDARLNGRHGIKDVSWLGNVYVGCHIGYNGDEHQVRLEGVSQYGTLLGCYIEGAGSDQLYVEGFNTTIIGGNCAARARTSPGGEILGWGQARARFAKTRDWAGTDVQERITIPGYYGGVIEWGSEAEPGGDWHLTHKRGLSPSSPSSTTDGIYRNVYTIGRDAAHEALGWTAQGHGKYEEAQAFFPRPIVDTPSWSRESVSITLHPGQTKEHLFAAGHSAFFQGLGEADAELYTTRLDLEGEQGLEDVAVVSRGHHWAAARAWYKVELRNSGTASVTVRATCEMRKKALELP